MEALHNLGIDGRLLLAQAVNFLILLFVLQRFAYKPMAAFLARRAAAIEKGLADAKDAARRVEEIVAREKESAQAAQAEARAIVARAEESATVRGAAILAATEQKASVILEEARAVATQERERILRETRADIVDLVTATTAAVLKDTAATDTAVIRRYLEK